MSWRSLVRRVPKREEPATEHDAIAAALLRLYADTNDEFYAEQAGMIRDRSPMWAERTRASAAQLTR